MGFDEGQIVFDHENLVYYPGQIVYGKLMFNQDKFKTFRGMYVKMKGYCNIHWTSTHTRKVNDRNETYTVEHNSHETYFEQKVYLLGGMEGEVHLQPGHHEFPFQCMIPPHSPWARTRKFVHRPFCHVPRKKNYWRYYIKRNTKGYSAKNKSIQTLKQCLLFAFLPPSSIETGNGHIRYEFRVVIDRSLQFDQEKVSTITVVNQKDLNLEPYCKNPMVFEFQESYCCWCMSVGSCDVTATMPQSGYCPGQTINIDLNCANKSNVEIDSIKFELFEHRKFIAQQTPETREEKKTLAVLKKGPIPGETTRNWTVEMDIPHMDLYNVDTCNFIDIHHTFEVTLSPSGCHSSTEAVRRIVLGHIPLRESGAPPPQETIVVNPVAPISQFPYPTNQQYPNQPYPGANPPYPGGIQTFPTQNPVISQPFPSANPFPGNMPFPNPNPGVHPQYPTSSPYPGANPPYSGANPPYLGANPPNPGANPPYPGANPPYPSANPGLPMASPYPVGSDPYVQNQGAQPGFSVSISENKDSAHSPLLPFPNNAPVSSTYSTATAPQP